MKSPLASHLTSSQASSGFSVSAEMAHTHPLEPHTKVSSPLFVGNSQVETFLNRPSIGAAPLGPQSKIQHHVPQVVATKSPLGNASYLVGTHAVSYTHLRAHETD